jgi:hypothetical protein
MEDYPHFAEVGLIIVSKLSPLPGQNCLNSASHTFPNANATTFSQALKPWVNLKNTSI